jgi:5-methylcytosine-specific restriction endonuclease McrA
MYPFTIRMINRIVEESSLQPLRCKIDPGSVTTGIALVLEKDTAQKVIALMELQHRGSLIKQRLQSRSAYRRRRRSNLRYRAPRFDNRTRKTGWLAPSLQHRTDSILHTVQRLQKIAPLTAATCEVVRFDTQKLKNPEIEGIEYQRGTLFGYEIREYLLEKWGRKCVYCDADGIPLEIDHMTPKSLGGSDRVDNLTLCCRVCNLKKGNTPLEIFAPKKAESLRRMPSLKDSAAVNSTRHKTYRSISLHLPCEAGTGGQTKYNRVRLRIPKTHALDASCSGVVSFLENWQIPTQKIVCMGRGSYQRTRSDRYGFPRGYLTRQKQIHGFQTGDRVRANVPGGKKQGSYSGRVAVRTSGNFNLQTESGLVEGISWRHCHLIERGNGYHYKSLTKIKQEEHVSSPP